MTLPPSRVVLLASLAWALGPTADGGELPTGPEPAVIAVPPDAGLPAGYPAPGPPGVARHISKHGIAMTAPVEMTLRSVGGESGGGGRGGAEAGDAEVRLFEADMFLMYATPALGTARTNGPVEVMNLPAVTVFSLGRRGADDPDWPTAALAELNAAVAADPAWEPAGPPRRLGYSSPFVPAKRRYREVQLPVRATADATPGDGR